MEPQPANLYSQHHQLQEQLTGFYSSLLFQSEYKFSSTNGSSTIYDVTYNPYLTEHSIPNPRVSTSTHSGLSLCDATDEFSHRYSSDDFLLPRVKFERPESFPNLSEMNYINPSSNVKETILLPTRYKNETSTRNLGRDNLIGQRVRDLSHGPHVMKEPLKVPGVDSNYFNCTGNLVISVGSTSSTAEARSNFSPFLPSINMATMDLCSQSFAPSSLDLNVGTVDLLSPTYEEACSSQSSQSSVANFMGELRDSPSSTCSYKNELKTPGVVIDGIGNRRRPNSFSDSKNCLGEIANKKQKQKQKSPVSRSSCPTLKVRKEKLGDRIAALQRLVAPYGKTDTASVLTEAIGYIQFLHDQVQTLSVPYLKPSNSKPNRTSVQGSSSKDMSEKVEPKRDLGSRGLCLVPQSCASYFNGYNGSI